MLIFFCVLFFDFFFFFFNDTATTEIYTLSLHDALPVGVVDDRVERRQPRQARIVRVREHVWPPSLVARGRNAVPALGYPTSGYEPEQRLGLGVPIVLVVGRRCRLQFAGFRWRRLDPQLASARS